MRYLFGTDMLNQEKGAKFQHQKMALAGMLMYELALRRQDAIELTFNHFKNLKKSEEGGYTISFKCVKQGVTREVTISENAVSQVMAYQRMKRKRNLPAEDTDQLFAYKSATSFADALKSFLRDRGYEHVQTHDFRVSRAC